MYTKVHQKMNANLHYMNNAKGSSIIMILQLVERKKISFMV